MKRIIRTTLIALLILALCVSQMFAELLPQETDAPSANEEISLSAPQQQEPINNQSPLDQEPLEASGQITEEAGPTADEPQPTVDESAPIIDEPQPTVDESAPIIDEPQPTADESAPIIDEPQPTVDESIPTGNDADQPTGEAGQITEPISNDPQQTTRETENVEVPGEPQMDQPTLIIRQMPTGDAWLLQDETIVLTFAVENASAYQWQFKPILPSDAEDQLSSPLEWEDLPGETGFTLILQNNVETLTLRYRCIASGCGQTIKSESVMLTDREFALRIIAGEITQEMYAYACEEGTLSVLNKKPEQPEETPDIQEEMTPGEAEPEGEIITESTVDITTESTIDITTESTVDITTESTVDITTESTVDITTESTVDITTESTVDITTESTVDITTESTVDITTESTVDITTESTVDVEPQIATQGEAEEATPSEATAGEATPAEATPSEATAGEATPAEATPSEATPGEVQILVVPQVERGEEETTISIEMEGTEAQHWQYVDSLDGEWQNLPGAEGSVLVLSNTAQSMARAYRLVGEQGETRVASAVVIPAGMEIAEWIVRNSATDEMVRRALKAPSLESMVLEGSRLIYVRSGKALASYNESTGILTDIASGRDVARLDAETRMIYPLKK